MRGPAGWHGRCVGAAHGAGIYRSASTAGGAPGRAVESLLYGWLGSHWSAVSVLLCLILLVPLAIRLGFPETARRTLEEIAPERAHDTEGGPT